MNFVIPMAGKGSRFTEAGYQLPKPLLRAHGKTLLEWSVDSLPLELCTNLIFIGLAEMNSLHQLEAKIRELYKHYNPQFIWLEKTTRGQAETVLLSEQLLTIEKPLLIFNIDTYFKSNILKTYLSNSKNISYLGSFKSQSPNFSYAKLNDNGRVVQVVEKEVISNYALTGLYHFAATVDFIRIAKRHIKENKLTKGEFYIAPIYEDLISEKAEVRVAPSDEFWVLGTPDEYTEFLQNFNQLPMKK